jgi:hypothetical protein
VIEGRLETGLPNCGGFFRDGGILHYARQSDFLKAAFCTVGTTVANA